MADNSHSLAERFSSWLSTAFNENKLPFLSAMLSGLVSHMFMLTNKLVNHDDIEALFSKGATVTSGRWGLEAIKLLMPDWSMPWIYGFMSLVLISVAVCLAIRLLDIRSKPVQAVLAALVLSFPSLTGTFCFMFTSSAYAVAFLLSVLAVYQYEKGGLKNAALAALYLLLCLGIYQAYVAITASLFVLLMIGACLEARENPWRIALRGLKALGMMLVSLAVYYCVTLLVFRFTGAEFNDYVLDNVNSSAGIVWKLRMAYESFFNIFAHGEYGLISTEFGRVLHALVMAITVLGLAALAFRAKSPLHALALLVLLVLLPLSINCMFLMMSPMSIHSLVLYSFVCVYMLTAIVLEKLGGRTGALAKDAVLLMLCAVVLGNVYFANRTYLKLYLQYENASSFYVSMIAQIKETEGFNEDSKLALIGTQDNMLWSMPELDTGGLLGPAENLVNIYSKENFFRRYLGFEVPFASAEELERISLMPEFEAMAEYPYYGSVQKIEDYIVVKLG